MWSLENPYILLFLLIIPVLVYIVHFRRKRGGVISFSFTIWKSDGFTPSFNPARIASIIFWMFFWTGFALNIMALAGPTIVEKERVFLTRGVDMIIALDESPSMSTPDFKPVNRFESAKQVIRQFTRSRENDQIGLVTFSSEAVLRIPPTLDYDVLEEVLENCKLMQLGEGTGIGLGIAVSVLHLKTSLAKDKVIILLTDGVNTEGEISPMEATDAAADLGIRIYTIGIGRESDLEWTFRDEATGMEYKGVSGDFDEELLVRIAERSGGKYFYAGDPRALNIIFDEIDSMEKTEKRVRIYVQRYPRHGIFILAGFILILAGFAGRKWFLKELL